MSFQFFVAPHEFTLTELDLRSLFSDFHVSVSFQQCPRGPVFMLETVTLDEAESLMLLLGRIRIDGVAPEVIVRESPEGLGICHDFGVSAHADRRKNDVMRLSSSLSILIVDENPASLKFIHGLLSVRLPKIHIDLACSAEAALAYNHNHEYQSILADMELSSLGGLGLMRAIQASRPHSPVTLMTANANLLPLMAGSGAFGYLRKPLHAEYCVAALRQAIQYHKLKVQVSAVRTQTDLLGAKAQLLHLAESQLSESKQDWQRAV